MTARRCSISRRAFVGGATAALTTAPAFAQPASGTKWPERLVRIVIPYPAGGSTDVLSRIIAERLKDKLGQSFIIENRPGAGGNIGIDAVAKAEPDGYTVGAATVGHFSINQYLYSKMPWDPDRDLAPVSMTWELPNVAVVPAQHVPAKTLQEFIAWAKARDGGIFFGSPGVGTTPHLSGALLGTRGGFTGDACAVPRRRGDHPGDAVRRRPLRHRQPRLLRQHHRGGPDAGARRHLADALADDAGGADDGGGRHAGFRRHVLGSLRGAEGDAARDRR